MARILRINMNDLSITEEKPRGKYAGLGGRALTSAVVAAEVPATCHPLSAENKLVFAPGVLSGTTAACSGRLSIGAKSPLTGTIKESNAGGMAAQAMARLGITALVVEGVPADGKQRVLKLTPGGAKLLPATGLKRRMNYALCDKLRQKHGDKISILCIGPAGEMKLLGASVAVTDPEGRPTRHAGRGGLGAVMGSKGLKAIVLDTAGTERPTSAKPRALKKAAAAFAKLLKKHPVTGEGLPTYGTNVLANIINSVGAYPTRNFLQGQFEGTEKISGETQRDTIIKRGGKPKHACHPGCTITCSRIYHDKKGKYLTKGPEYETVWAHGANCGIDNLDAIAEMDRLDDEIGLDTIEMGAAIGVAMEAGVIKFGDAKGAIRLLKEVGKGTPLGRIIGCGAKVVGETFGVARVPVVKGQAMPAYDPRAAKGIGVTYATSTMGADHTAGYSITANVLGVGGNVDALKAKGQVELSRNLQIATAALDSTGLCLFVAFCVLDEPKALQAICDMLAAHTGKKFTTNEFAALGKKVLRTERAFNKRAGFTKLDDRLPDFFKTEALPPHDAVFDVPDKELDKVFNF
ncbi:MAG: aldehyde ferredoxin oxidoreductase [Planctomycetes bacterium]|nr:aldehyde ferredoxin oxidoreductase [Planctomycetota bacterium]